MYAPGFCKEYENYIKLLNDATASGKKVLTLAETPPPPPGSAITCCEGFENKKSKDKEVSKYLSCP